MSLRHEIRRIEDLVNGWTCDNASAHVREMSYAEALEAGAIAIFEEKYGDRVRVVSFGDFSTELCGGTHAAATGEIGMLKIVSQSGIASGVRRIEALTGFSALDHVREQGRALQCVADLLKAPVAEVPARVEKLLEERRAMEQQMSELRARERGRPSACNVLRRGQHVAVYQRREFEPRQVVCRLPGPCETGIRRL